MEFVVQETTVMFRSFPLAKKQVQKIFAAFEKEIGSEAPEVIAG